LYSSFVALPSTPPTQIYPLSLHDALPISANSLFTQTHIYNVLPFYMYITGIECILASIIRRSRNCLFLTVIVLSLSPLSLSSYRSEEHTSELQSRENLVCRLLLEKKKRN